ncbi:CDP-alcohol phosphatidyltransferase family protein [Phaeobacter sp. BS52]|uniref:CDP-alcohol phosphatidyltransferase family protein n=1 Tax=Phaeobacter sp. BS52 TaxID=2907241 RepID=UPI00386FA98F
MFDSKIRPLIDPMLNAQGQVIARVGISANQVTLLGLALGLLSAGMIACGLFALALLPLLLSRLADGLDGAVARASGPSDFGGYLDITCDFLFYGAVPLAFVLADPGQNAVAGAFLLMTFYVNGTSFLGYAVLAEKHKMKSTARGVKTLYFTGGLLEGAETIGFFVLLCLLPAWFAPMAWVFGALCLVTASSRVLLALRVFHRD